MKIKITCGQCFSEIPESGVKWGSGEGELIIPVCRNCLEENVEKTVNVKITELQAKVDNLFREIL